MDTLRSVALRVAQRAYHMVVSRGLRYELRWQANYFAIRRPKTKTPPGENLSGVENAIIENAIIAGLQQHAIEVADHDIDIADYKRWVEEAGYEQFPHYYGGGTHSYFVEKSLEHYLAARFLGLRQDDVYIDIASATSPAPDIYRKLYGCTVYKQDWGYPRGVNGDVIGGDAGDLPVRADFATKMALHNSFEHFEQDSDIRFIKEARRVLRKGGKVCIVPLYLCNQYVVLTDPAILHRNSFPSFERDATVVALKHYDRHGRMYDIPHFVTRVVNSSHGLRLTVHITRNEKAVGPSCDVKFVAVFEKE